MVAVDPAAWDRQRKLSERDENGLSAFDKEVIGSGVRIEIPFEDPIKLRAIADMLRGYANTIDFVTRRDDLPMRSQLMQLKLEARAINSRIRDMHGKSRKWKSG